MAKKNEEIKAEQGFRKVGPTCSNCKYFSTTSVTKKYKGWDIGGKLVEKEYQVESYLRCSLGNFKVGRSNWCREHKWREDEQENQD